MRFQLCAAFLVMITALAYCCFGLLLYTKPAFIVDAVQWNATERITSVALFRLMPSFWLLYVDASTVLIGLGLCVLAVSVCGFQGDQSREWPLLFSGGLLAFSFGSFLAAAKILCHQRQAEKFGEEELALFLNQSYFTANTSAKDMRLVFAQMMKDMKCCGVHGANDFKRLHWVLLPEFCNHSSHLVDVNNVGCYAKLYAFVTVLIFPVTVMLLALTGFNLLIGLIVFVDKYK